METETLIQFPVGTVASFLSETRISRPNIVFEETLSVADGKLVSDRINAIFELAAKEANGIEFGVGFYDLQFADQWIL